MKLEQYQHGSSHYGHVAYLVALFLLGGLIGYGVGMQYERARIAESQPLEKTVAKEGSANSTAADWKTYSNSTLGISFKYPKDWYIEEAPSDSRIYIRTTSAKVDKETKPSDFQQLWISYATNESSVTEENNTKAGKPGCCEITDSVSVSTVTSGDLTINTYQFTSGGGPVIEAYWSDPTGKRYTATNASEIGTTNQTNEIANLKIVLSTFKFEADSTVDSKTYTNQKYAYSFKYPTDWGYKEVSPEQVELRQVGKSYSIENSDTYGVGIFVSQTNYKTAAEAADAAKKPFEDANANTKVATQTTTFGGKPAARIGTAQSTSTFVVLNGYQYSIVIPNFGDRDVQLTIENFVADKLVSTFKFAQ